MTRIAIYTTLQVFRAGHASLSFWPHRRKQHILNRAFWNERLFSIRSRNSSGFTRLNEKILHVEELYLILPNSASLNRRETPCRFGAKISMDFGIPLAVGHFRRQVRQGSSMDKMVEIETWSSELIAKFRLTYAAYNP